MPGAEAAAARRSVGHRSPGAARRAGAEADEPAAVRARQHARADRGRAAGRARGATAPRRRSPSRRSRSPTTSRPLTLPDAPNARRAPPDADQQTPREPGRRRDRRRDPQRAEVRAAATAFDEPAGRRAIRTSRRRSSSTPRASSSARGSAASSRRSGATGSFPYAAMSMQRARRDHVLRAQGRLRSPTCSVAAAVARSTRSTTRRSNALAASNPTQPLPPEYPDDKAFFTVTFFFNETPPGDR